MARRLTYIVLLLVCACGGTSITSTEDASTDSRKDSETHDSPIIVDVAPSDTRLCLPKGKAEACSTVDCGITLDGCGGYYICYDRDVTSCSGCQDYSNKHECFGGKTAYKCDLGIIPLGCDEVDFSAVWCCTYF